MYYCCKCKHPTLPYRAPAKAAGMETGHLMFAAAWSMKKQTKREVSTAFPQCSASLAPLLKLWEAPLPLPLNTARESNRWISFPQWCPVITGYFNWPASGVYWHLGFWHLGFWHLGYWHLGYWHLGYWHLVFWHLGYWHLGFWICVSRQLLFRL